MSRRPTGGARISTEDVLPPAEPADGGDRSPPRRRRWIAAQVAVSVAVLGLLLHWAAPQGELAGAFARARPLPLLATGALSLLAHVGVASWRWHVILGRMGHPLPFRHVLAAFAGGLPIRLFVPFRAGELARGLQLARRSGLPLPEVLSSVAFDKASTLVALALLGLVGLLAYGLPFPGEAPLAVALGAGVVTLSSHRLQLALTPFVRRAPRRWASTFEGLVAAFVGVGGRDRVAIGGLAVAETVLESLVFWGACLSLGLSLPAGPAILLVPLAILTSNAVVFSHAGFGVREAFVLGLFLDLESRANLLAAGILFSALTVLLPAIAGLLALPEFLRTGIRAAPDRPPEAAGQSSTSAAP